MATSSTPSLGFASPAFKARAQGRRKMAERRFGQASFHVMPTSVQLPARFEDVDEEKMGSGKHADDLVYQKSIYGMFTQAGSSAKLEEGGDSGSEGEGEDVAGGAVSEGRKGEVHGKEKQSLGKKMFTAMLKPARERDSSTRSRNTMSQSQILPREEPNDQLPERPSSDALRIRNDAPVMDRKLEVQAQADMAESTTSASGKSKEKTGMQEKSIRLPKALTEIFGFDEVEEVIAQWPCWYLQNQLVQGHMYITSRHVCFFAYLPRKGTTAFTSHLAKQGKRDPRYSRHWFVLKGDILSYYKSSAQPYYPVGTVDLRFAITAELAPQKGEDVRNTTYFTIKTDRRTYYLRAESTASAKEWVKQLQNVIFRSHNDGHTLKISIPIKDIFDVVANPVMSAADTVNVSVIDKTDDFSIEDYLFTFFGRGREALQVLQDLTANNEAKEALEDESEEEELDSALLDQAVPVRSSPPTARAKPMEVDESERTSVETSRGSSKQRASQLDRGRQSFGEQRDHKTSETRRSSGSPIPRFAHESTDSFATTSEDPAESSSSILGKVDMSASMMLTDDNVFRGPNFKTLQLQRGARENVGHTRKDSQETSRSSSREAGERTNSKQPSLAPKDPNTKPEQSSLARRSTDKSSVAQSKRQESTTMIGSRPPRPVTMPLQHAATLAGYVRDTGKRMGSYLSSSPGIYIDKFAGAMAGGKRHYGGAESFSPEDRIPDPEDDEETAQHERSFQKHFSLPTSEKLVAVFFGSLHRVLPLYGKIYIGMRWFCFRSLLPGTNTKIVIPLKDVDNVEKEKGYRFGYPGLILVIRGHEELFFDFKTKGLRDDCVVTVLRGLDAFSALHHSAILAGDDTSEAEEVAAAENEKLMQARDDRAMGDSELSEKQMDDGSALISFDDASASVVNFKPKESLRITCLTIGSRGDVQPYIALCKGLLAEGHQPKIATHKEFEGWVRKHGIDFAPVEGNPAELMQLCVEYGMFTPKFLSHTNAKFRGWLDELLESAWTACQNSDLLIESPSAMAGIHIAEALGIPYFRAFTMPWTRTRAYPHAFAALNSKMGGSYNIASYTVFENIFWHMTARQVNRWRHRSLGLHSTGLGRMQQNKIPFLYNFSPSVVVPPLDFSDWIRVTGYWFLDESSGWQPPADLLAFIEQARKDNMKLVYIGFGSVVVSDSKALTQHIVDAVLKADVRCILSKGWSDRLDAKEPNKIEIPLPSSIFQISSAPHDWLFKQIDAAVHHGGAGTTGASLRAGIPTIIKPFFGDQFFFASRIEDIGVGLRVPHITQNSLGKSLWIATHDDRMRNKARALGERIRAEDGVQTAIKAIYRDMEYAKTLVRTKEGRKIPGSKVGEGGDVGAEVEEEEEEVDEENWTFVESESEVDSVGHKGATIGNPMGWKAHALQRNWLGGR